MKRILQFSFFLIPLIISAQTVITFEDHCYKENVNYAYQLVDYVAPGEGGEHQVWDFSRLKDQEKMNGEMNVERYAINNKWFPDANILVEEFGNQFLFQSDPDGMRQVGYISKDKTNVITFTKPPVKLTFPMHYADHVTGEAEMQVVKTGKVKTGTYDVTADAYGTLILPGDLVFENALRVSSIVKYTDESGGIQEQKVFRWYVQHERFPVMVVQEISYLKTGVRSNTTYKAAYNSLAIEHKTAAISPQFSLSPNPAKNHVQVQFYQPQVGNVQISLYNMDGQLVDNLYNASLPEGNQQLNFKLHTERAVPGAYIVKIQCGNDSKTAQLILAQ